MFLSENRVTLPMGTLADKAYLGIPESISRTSEPYFALLTRLKIHEWRSSTLHGSSHLLQCDIFDHIEQVTVCRWHSLIRADFNHR